MKCPAILLLLALGAASPLSAQDHVTIYRCTDASGALLIQNDQPCPAGHRQETQVIDVPPPMPAHVPREVRMPEVVAAEDAAFEAAILEAVPEPVPVAERTTPPPLFQCTTWDNIAYLTGDEEPAERCAPMRVVGMDGRPRPTLGSACQTTRDRCEAIPEEGLCDAWQRRVDEAEFRWKFAGAAAEDPKRFEYEVLAATLANST
ncbi:MAG TPA: hypothetical protein VFS99_04780, partial [Xanthomonadaceae bacterium]|nr:hypothetical protein [Xanthomonadaceae bacterium]